MAAVADDLLLARSTDAEQPFVGTAPRDWLPSRVLALCAVVGLHALALPLLSLVRTVTPVGFGTVAEVSLLQEPGVPPAALPSLHFKPLLVPRPELTVASVDAFNLRVEAADAVPGSISPARSGSEIDEAPAEPVQVQVPDLELLCPNRQAPAYPAESRRLHEQGEVTLRVELDEQGRVRVAAVTTSSGHARLDNAARATVLGWRCEPARRAGHAVPAVAVQSLEFVLERRGSGRGGQRG